MSTHIPWVPSNFLALTESQSRLDEAKVVLIPVPYDSTTSYKSGARYGPSAIIEASAELEDYDLEIDADISEIGIHTTPYLEPHLGSPELMVERIRIVVEDYLESGKFVGVLGGEHSVTIGSAMAHQKYYPDTTVLYLDAHADLRSEYMGTQWGHASGARRIHETGPLVLAGVRSLSYEEKQYIDSNSVFCVFWPPKTDSHVAEIINNLSKNVYVTVDLDVLDPSMMSAVGTPEPGGMDWYQMLALLKRISEERNIVGFDVSELSPTEGSASCAYIASKLVYKLIGYTHRSSSG